MRRLAGAHELLDGDLNDARALAGNLRDLRRLNRFFGGVTLSRHAVDAVIRDAHLPADAPISLLDVGTGAGDIPNELTRDSRRRGRTMRVMGIDSRAEVLALASSGDDPSPASSLTLRVADARTLPFDDGSFDIAHASLLMHHLEPAEAATVIREMARVARLGIVVNDLARGRFRWLGAWLLLHLITRNRFTRHDGPLSVRRAYSMPEARQMLIGAGLRIVHEETAVMGHRWAIAAVRP